MRQMSKEGAEFVATLLMGCVVVGGWFAYHLIRTAADPPTTSGSPAYNTTYTQPTTQQLGVAGNDLVDWQYGSSANSIGTLVENATGQTSWEGSNQFPGQWKFQSAAHGATVVTWTLKALPGNDGGFRSETQQVFEFKISQDGTTVWALNADANFIMSLATPSGS